MAYGERMVLGVAMAFALAVGGCATLPEDFHRPVSHAYTDTDDTALGRWAQSTLAEHPAPAAYRPLASGVDAFVARAVLARKAERSIDAQYYLLHDDLTGRLFLHELLKAADRGVRVRLLVDDMAIPGRDPQMAALATHPNIAVRIFNPFSRNAPRATQFLTRFGSVTRRMHNKSFTVDNRVTILGGRNIGDEYFEAAPTTAYGDLDVILIGKAVQEVSASFDDYWNSELSYPIGVLLDEAPSPGKSRRGRALLDRYVAEQRDSAYLKALRDSDLAERLRNRTLEFYRGNAVVVYDEPEKIVQARGERHTHLLPKLQPYFERLDEELIIIAAYFVPGRLGTDYLTGLSEQGVRVRVLTNSLSATDVTVVHAGYSRYRKDLLEGGVELYEMKAAAAPVGDRDDRRRKASRLAGSSIASLHAKAFILDREEVFIGSLNLDPRSAAENTEIGVVMDAPAMAVNLARWFDENIERIAYRLQLCTRDESCSGISWYEEKADGATVVYDTEPKTSFWRRFAVGVLRLLPFESQL